MKQILSIFFFSFLFLSCEKEEKVVSYEIDATNSDLKLENGVLLYKSKSFTGFLNHYDKVNQTQNRTHYLSGKKDGKELKKYRNDQIAEERFFRKGMKVGTHKSFWPNGIPKFEYHFNDEGVYHGNFKEWYTNGQLAKEFHYVQGKEDGPQKMWRYDGKIRANYVVKNGERFGLIGLKKCYAVNTKNEEI